MKKCELCNKVARMYCESDEASLCWDCDSRVHTANFLVAKHTRTLLCHACQRLTPWTGSGSKLGPTVSVCEACVHGRDRDEDEDEGEGGGDDDDDDDSENQVVPLSLPPSLASTSYDAKPTTAAIQNARFSYDVSDKAAEEKNGSRKMRSWKWR
ncbi:B-box type zinc finger family protein [Perilla frutescens var. hirtella]|nr:B-box type zinc finger family protein [Perilla frutescens var. hirtella]